MRVSTFMAAATAVLVFNASALAQVVGIGSTKGGTVAQNSATIANVVSTHAGFQMRTQPMGGTQQYIPLVNAGELEFGIGNMMQTYMAYSGTGISKGNKYDKLRLVTTMMVYKTGPIVTNRSGIRKLSDLKGKRVPFGFKSAPLFQIFLTGFLANGGLTWDDVNAVPVIAPGPQWEAFKQGKVDVVFGGPGAGFVKDLNASIDGGVRFLSFDTNSADAKKTMKIMPRTYYIRIEPSPGFVAVPEPVQLIAYDFMLFAGASVSDDIVYKVAKVMHERADELKAVSPIWSSYSADRVAKDQGMPYHPAAEKYYKEVGLWRR